MSVEFEHAEAALGDVTLHYVTAGDGPPVLLVHGWPQTWFEWRHVIPRLADRFRLVAPDLRGLGDSSCPAAGYDMATVAGDLWSLMHDVLGHERFAVAGHDWGGPAAFALAAAHRAAVRRLAIIDVAIPGDGAANISQGGRRWHHAFHQTEGLPEALVAGREDVYLGWFYRNYGATPDAVDAEAVAEYLRSYREPARLRAGFEYYRNIPRAVSQNEAALAAGPLPMPVLALGGTEGWGRGLEVLESCRRVARHVSGGVVEQAGHWIPEEQPARLATLLGDFFAE
ncbi:MAG: alpha/beta fold hydrolase [Gammaproteobacteria bacterium]